MHTYTQWEQIGFDAINALKPNFTSRFYTGEIVLGQTIEGEDECRVNKFSTVTLSTKIELSEKVEAAYAQNIAEDLAKILNNGLRKVFVKAQASQFPENSTTTHIANESVLLNVTEIPDAKTVVYSLFYGEAEGAK